MKISKKRLTQIILEECEMMDGPVASYNMDGLDDEGAMAKRQLHDMEKYAQELSMMLTDTTQLESWVQAKLTKAADYLKTVKHYVEYGMEEGAYDQVEGETVPMIDGGYNMDDEMIVSMLEKLSKK